MHNGSNKRTDQYGGSIENRTRFLLEVITAVRKAWAEAAGPNSPLAGNVGLRLTPYGTYLDMSDTDSGALFRHVISEINKFNLCYLHMVEPRANGGTDEFNESAIGVVHGLGRLFKGVVLSAGGYRPDTASAAVYEAHHAKSGPHQVLTWARSRGLNSDRPQTSQTERLTHVDLQKNNCVVKEK